jgi:hypothetical protein
MAVAGRVLDLFVPEQHLDGADVLVMLQEVGGKGVAK